MTPNPTKHSGTGGLQVHFLGVLWASKILRTVGLGLGV